MTEHGYTTSQARDFSEFGLEKCLDKMASLVATEYARYVGAMSRLHASLPYIDEHAVTIEASRVASWVALQQMLESAGPGWFARLLGCADTAASGPRPMEEGSTVPGFHVVAADAPGELSLAGRHHFSDYALIFRLDELSEGGTRLRAESRAHFTRIRRRSVSDAADGHPRSRVRHAPDARRSQAPG